MSLLRLTIPRKLAFAFAAVVGVILVMSTVVYLSLQSVRHSAAETIRNGETITAAEAVLMALVEQQNAARGFVASRHDSFPGKFEKAGKEYEAALAELTRLADEPEEQTRITALTAAVKVFQDETQVQMAEARDASSLDRARATIFSTGRLTDTRAALKAIMDPLKAEALVRAADENRSNSIAQWSLIIGGALAALLSAALGLVLSRAIASPVSAMTGVMTRLASGDNDVTIPGAGRGDEIGDMAGAVESFRQAAIARVALEEKAAAQGRAAEETRAAAEAERAHTAKEQAEVVGSVAKGLEQLSEGVLTFRITQAFAPAYEKLRADFNEAMERLQETMKVVSSNAQGLRAGAGEISQASDDLSRRTEQQAASLEETAAALDQITATVRKTAEGAGEAHETVSAARADAEKSGVVVRDAVTAMSEIEGSAQQISQIIGVIDEIAFQTNLLALNAGVEAARAGDAGRGFAVVASEVRALAQRSADAAKEIKTLISASSRQVEQGVNLVGETGKALERIVSQVAKLSGVVSEIAASAQEQSTGLQQVNVAVNQMDQVTQQNAAMVEETTAASHALAAESETLSQLIARFDVGESAAAYSAPRAAAPARPVARPSARPAAAPARRHAASSVPATRGATALATATHADTDSWEEF